MQAAPVDATAFRRDLMRWFRANGRDLPWRRTRDPYAVLVSEIMLQQTQVATVLPFYHRWLRRFPTFAALSNASLDDVLHAWQGLGYYRRARNLHAAAQVVCEQFGGNFPRDIDAMRSLPGIGKYTAHAIATFAFGAAVPLVEANTARLMARLHDMRLPIDSANGNAALWNAAASLVPKHEAHHHNSALMDFGALICNARTPSCITCPVKTHCRTTDPASLPIKRARTKTLLLTETHAFIRQQDRVLLRQSSDRWKGMWILPPHVDRQSAPLLHESAFPFTHHRVTLRVFPSRRANFLSTERWVRISDLHSVAMPSPHRRAITALLAKPCDTKRAA